MSVAPVARNTLAQRYLYSVTSVYNRIMTGPMQKLQIPNFENANCVNTPPEWFYEEDRPSAQTEVIELARSVCADCVERVACLKWALKNEKHGMWGGYTANERKAMKEQTCNLTNSENWIERTVVVERSRVDNKVCECVTCRTTTN